MLHKHILSYFNIIIILLLLHNVPWISFQLVYIIFSIKVFSHVLVYIYIYIPEPYCISSPSHRWRLEEASGLHSPPARMWWTLNYLADRSYSPPAPNRGLCQALTSTSSPHTHHLTKQIYAYGLHSFLMLSFSGFLFPLCSCFVVFFNGNMRMRASSRE